MTTNLEPSQGQTPKPWPSPPPTEVKTIRDALKILFAVVAWYVLTGLNSALEGAVDYHNLGHFGPFLHFGPLWSTLAWGALFGALQGLIIGLKALDFFWAGPTFFGAVQPVMSIVSSITSSIIINFRRAWNSRPSDDGGKSPRPIPAGDGGTDPAGDGNPTGSGNPTGGNNPTGGGNDAGQPAK